MKRLTTVVLAAAFALLGTACGEGTESPLSNEKPPEIAGSPCVGAILSGATGNWGGSGQGVFLYSYFWQRCANGACEIVQGQLRQADRPSVSYQVKAEDLGKSLKLRVLVEYNDESAWAESNEIGPVVPATDSACN